MENTAMGQESCEETDPKEIFMVVLKKKKLIVAVTLLAGAAAFIISLALPKTYLIGTSLQIGAVIDGVGAQHLIEGADQVKEKRDKDVYGVLVRQKLGISQADYPRIISESGKDTAIISFSTEFSDVGQAKKIFEELNKTIIASQETIFNSAKTEIEKNIEVESVNRERLNAKIDLLRSEQAIYQGKISALQKMFSGNFEPQNELVTLDVKEDLATVKREIEESYFKINESQRLTTVLQSYLSIMQPTRVIKEPYASEAPIGSDTELNTIMGLMLGLFAGVFLAFLTEWWARPRKLK